MLTKYLLSIKNPDTEVHILNLNTKLTDLTLSYNNIKDENIKFKELEQRKLQELREQRKLQEQEKIRELQEQQERHEQQRLIQNIKLSKLRERLSKQIEEEIFI